MTEKKEGNCFRCGQYASELFPIEHEYEDMNGHTGKEQVWICWSCDHDILNGNGDLDDDPADVYISHWENEYSYDPVNTPPPPGYS